MREHSIPSVLDEISAGRAERPLRPAMNEYAMLKQLIKQKGLLEKQPGYYTYKILSSLGLLVEGIAFLLLVHIFWLRLLDAVFLAFVCGQIAFVCHDSGHRQIFHATWKNDLVFLLQANLLLGMSYAWWLETHNAHHSHPNELDMDPDISIPALCYSEEEAQKRRGIWRFIAKYQAFFFFPFTLLVSIEFQRSSVFFLIKNHVKYHWAEWSLLLLHYMLFFWLVFSMFNLWQGIVFLLVHQGFLGLYLGTTFAPNHKGMPLLERDSGLDFLRR